MTSGTLILLDTHVAVWLHGGERRRMPRAVQQRLEREPIALSPFVELELGYLYEVKRVSTRSQVVIEHLIVQAGAVVADISALAVCEAALGISWTRDPFDRLIAAHATAARLTLVTADEVMRRHLPLAWWAD